MINTSTPKITVFASAYAINPFKGSEDGMGWNFVLQIARNCHVIAVTRKNNRPAIEKYQQEHPELSDLYKRIEFRYYDWPKRLLFWKKGPVLSLIYYYFWQLGLALHFRSLKNQVDVVHNLNFHNDWTPSFLWIWRKPFVWGPVGHHPRIPKGFIRPFYSNRNLIMDRFLWTLKNIFWYLDPFLKITRNSADHIFCMHQEAANKLGLKNKYSILPSVASEEVDKPIDTDEFIVLSAGRFVGLKGFDITIEAFHQFYIQLKDSEQRKAKLILVGSGPEKHKLKALALSLGISAQLEIIEWIPRDELKKIYQTTSVFLFPSHEGAGMVVAEALSYGVPVLCWDNCGPGRFIHPDSALKIAYDPNSDWKNAFADQLLRLKHDATFYQQERILARQRFLSTFLWDNRADELYSVYKDVAGKTQDAFANSEQNDTVFSLTGNSISQ
jgi:glycosyltransferase involved in cell wall biosynthesis